MFDFLDHHPDTEYGALIDVGSGSVAVAVVASVPDGTFEFIWTHREHISISNDASHSTSTKRITSTLVNTILELGNAGVKALKNHNKRACLEKIQVTLSAPWAYTVTKTVAYEEGGDTFVVTKSIIKDLVTQAHTEAIEAIGEPDVVEKIGLSILSKATVGVTINGYSTRSPINKSGEKCTLTHTTGLVQKDIKIALEETIQKVLPKTQVRYYTFMLAYYCVVRDLLPDTMEVCLIDVTNEATEIGIVRSNLLKYVTHTPFGKNWLIREMAETIEVSKGEIISLMKNPDLLINYKISSTKKDKLEELKTIYESEVTDLIKRTGDNLSIPRTIFLHTDTDTESFFSTHIRNSARVATKSEHSIHLATSKLLANEQNTHITDTAILVSGHFFHKNNNCNDFDLL